MYTSGEKLFQLNHGTSGAGAKEFVIPFFHPDEARKIIFIAFLCWCFNWFSFQRYKNTKCSSLKTFFESLTRSISALKSFCSNFRDEKCFFSQLNQREKKLEERERAFKSKGSWSGFYPELWLWSKLSSLKDGWRFLKIYISSQKSWNRCHNGNLWLKGWVFVRLLIPFVTVSRALPKRVITETNSMIVFHKGRWKNGREKERP